MGDDTLYDGSDNILLPMCPINPIDGFEARLIGDNRVKGSIGTYCRMAGWPMEYVGSVDLITEVFVFTFRDLLKVCNMSLSRPLGRKRAQNMMMAYTETINSFMTYPNLPAYLKPLKLINKETTVLNVEEVSDIITFSERSGQPVIKARNKAILYLIAEGVSG